MWNYLKFPEQFRVHKSISKEQYLKNGNLTPAEEKKLGAYMNDVKILYAILFPDKSEMIVLSSDIILPAQNRQYFLQNYTKAIAQSFPYLSLLILRCNGVIKFFLFDEKTNLHDEGRMAVNKIYATPDILFIENNWLATQFVNSLRSDIAQATSAKQLHQLWQNSIISFSCGEDSAKNNAEIFSFDNSVMTVKKIQQRRKSLDTAIDIMADLSEAGYCEDIVLEDEDFDDERKSTLGDILEENIFIEFCKQYCWSLYEEACKLEGDSDFSEGNCSISQDGWLRDYIEACNEYAYDMFKKKFDSNSMRKITEAFYSHITPDYPECDGDSIFDIEELKAMPGAILL